MSKHTDDDRFDEWVKDAARSYNRPPDIVPRDAMWDDLQARGARREARGVESIGAGREGRGSRMAFPIWSLAAAAMLLLAVGIGVGRMSMRHPDATVARQDTVVPQSRPSDSTVPVSPNAVVVSTPRDTNRVIPRAGVPREAVDANLEARGPLYDIAAVQYLSAAEALLTSFRAARDTAMDDVMRRWARDLLSTTRLLLDSPAAGDAQRRQLLEDLEVVLVQMVKLPAKDARFDRELIERSIARQQVLTRIRTSIPVGTASGT